MLSDSNFISYIFRLGQKKSGSPCRQAAKFITLLVTYFNCNVLKVDSPLQEHLVLEIAPQKYYPLVV